MSDPFREITSFTTGWKPGFQIGLSINRFIRSLFWKSYENKHGQPHPDSPEGKAKKTLEKQRQRLLLENPNVHGSARWYSQEEQRKDFNRIVTRLERQEDDTFITLGRPFLPRAVDGRWSVMNEPLIIPAPEHVLTVAPTRSGKGAAHIVPNLLTYSGSVFVNDPKGENYKISARARKQFGPVLRIDPFTLTGGTSHYNPLNYVKTESDARLLADMLLPKSSKADDKADIWRNESLNLLIGIILYIIEGHEGPATMGTVYEFFKPSELPITCTENHGEFIDPFTVNMTKMAHRAQHPEARRAAMFFVNKAEKEQSGVKSTINQSLTIWSDPAIGSVVNTEESDFNFEDLSKGTFSVYVILPFHLLESYSAFQRVILEQARHAMLKRDTADYGRSVLFILDEFSAMGRVPDIVNSLSYMAGYGVRLWLFVQNLNQLMSIYPDLWKGLLSEVSVVSYFGTRDTITGQHISQQLGMTTEVTETVGVSGNHSRENRNRPTTSGGLNYVGRPLATPDEVLRNLSHKAVQYVFIRGGTNVAATLDHWYENPNLWQLGDDPRKPTQQPEFFLTIAEMVEKRS